MLTDRPGHSLRFCLRGRDRSANGPEGGRIIERDVVSDELDAQSFPELPEIDRERPGCHFAVELVQDPDAGRLVPHFEYTAELPPNRDGPALGDDGA